MSNAKVELLEINGSEEICIIEEAKKRTDNVSEEIEELKNIIRKKNEIIEQQTDYIQDLQEENHNLRHSIRMLSM